MNFNIGFRSLNEDAIKHATSTVAHDHYVGTRHMLSLHAGHLVLVALVINTGFAE